VICPASLSQTGSAAPLARRRRAFFTSLVPNTRRIALTGGPGAGKTQACLVLAAAAPHLFVHVPEAASQVYDLLQTRWDRLDAAGRREVQRQIYRMQLNQEATFARSHPDKILLVDRGSVDGAAYWPDGPDAYWTDLSTSHTAELSRYDAAIWLQSSAAIGAYDGPVSNPCRFEDPAAAIDTGARLQRLWQPHPRLHCVEACRCFDDKLARIREVLGTIARRSSPQQILPVYGFDSRDDPAR